MRIFRDKVAIVTGAASGIGRALSQQLALHGAKVVLVDLQAELLAETTAHIGGHATSAIVDVTDAGAVKAVVDETFAREGRLDYMFNNAGIAIIGDALKMPLADWNRVLDVNVRGVVNGVVAAYPVMVGQGSGHIVNTASIAGLMPVPSFTAYAASKHAVVGLSRSLRAEGKALGVKVSTICPGIIQTAMVDNAKWIGLDRDAVMADNPLKHGSADYCAQRALRGVAKNKQDIVITTHARVFVWLQRWFPWLVAVANVRQMKKVRQLSDETPTPTPGA